MITEKEIATLNQLDRIEYRQKRREIKEEWNGGTLYLMEVLSFVAFVILALLELLFFEVKGIHLIKSIDLNFYVIVFCIIISLGFITDIIIYFKRESEMKKLDSEFFHFEIKPKEDKNGKGKRRGN